MEVKFKVTFREGNGEARIQVTRSGDGQKKRLTFETSGEQPLDLAGTYTMTITGVSPPGGTEVIVTWDTGTKIYSAKEGIITELDELQITSSTNV